MTRLASRVSLVAVTGPKLAPADHSRGLSYGERPSPMKLAIASGKKNWVGSLYDGSSIAATAIFVRIYQSVVEA
jgi:hypothetical protein